MARRAKVTYTGQGKSYTLMGRKFERSVTQTLSEPAEIAKAKVTRGFRVQYLDELAADNKKKAKAKAKAKAKDEGGDGDEGENAAATKSEGGGTKKKKGKKKSKGTKKKASKS